jgi:hypothetical protein
MLDAWGSGRQATSGDAQSRRSCKEAGACATPSSWDTTSSSDTLVGTSHLRIDSQLALDTSCGMILESSRGQPTAPWPAQQLASPAAGLGRQRTQLLL